MFSSSLLKAKAGGAPGLWIASMAVSESAARPVASAPPRWRALVRTR